MLYKIADLPETLPLFPLPGALLLPRGRLPLQIFEPRYLAMLEDTLKTTARLIGMVQPTGARDGHLHKVGCVGRVVGFSEADDGRYMITLAGISRFHITAQLDGGTPYMRGAVDWDGFSRDRGAIEHDPGFNRAEFLGLLERFFDLEDLEVEWGNLENAPEEMLINSLATLAPFQPEDKQALLEAQTLALRREPLVPLMEFALRRGDGKGVVQ
jgi:Lon protease-like protein